MWATKCPFHALSERVNARCVYIYQVESANQNNQISNQTRENCSLLKTVNAAEMPEVLFKQTSIRNESSNKDQTRNANVLFGRRLLHAG